MPLYALAARVSPLGHEALVFAWMMSLGHVGLALSDVLGTRIAETFGLGMPAMLFMFAGFTAARASLLALVPPTLFAREPRQG